MTKADLENELIKERKEHIQTLDDLKKTTNNYLELQRKYVALASNTIGFNKKK